MQRGRAAGGAPAAGAPGKQPKWKRTVMEWEMLPGGEAVLETSLDAFIEAHNDGYAPATLPGLHELLGSFFASSFVERGQLSLELLGDDATRTDFRGFSPKPRATLFWAHLNFGRRK